MTVKISTLGENLWAQKWQVKFSTFLIRVLRIPFPWWFLLFWQFAKVLNNQIHFPICVDLKHPSLSWLRFGAKVKFFSLLIFSPLIICKSIELSDSFWNTLLSWLRFGAKVKSLAEIDSRPLSELSIDKSFTKKSQNWRLYNRIQIWLGLRTIKRSRLLIIRTIALKWLTIIANYRHWHGQLSWRALVQILGAVRFFPASSILSSRWPNISSHSVLVLAQY